MAELALAEPTTLTIAAWLLHADHLSRVGEALVGIHDREGGTTVVLVGERFWRQAIDGTERGAVPRTGTACPRSQALSKLAVTGGRRGASRSR